MANADTTLDLDALHDAIEEDIKAQFPDLQTVEFYRQEDRHGVIAPAIILDLPEFEGAPDVDPGTEQLAVTARFEAEIVMGFRTPNVKRAIRKFSAAFAAWMRLRRFTRANVHTGPAQVIGCYRDEFNPELDKYEVWRVEWTMVLHFGDSVWKNDGSVPTQVFSSFMPDVGNGNTDSYTPLIPGGQA